MSFQLSTFFEQTFKANLEALLLEPGGQLEMAVASGEHTGKEASPVKQVGAVTVREVTSRFGAARIGDVETQRRWVLPRNFATDQLGLDQWDFLQIATESQKPEVSDYAGQLAANTMQAMTTQKEDLILGAFFAAATVGASGATTTTAFPAANQVAATVGAAAATGLNVEKLQAGLELLQANKVDLSREAGNVYCILTPQTNKELMNSIKANNSDYADAFKPVYNEFGMLSSLMGIKFIMVATENRIPLNGSSQWRIPLWVKRSMYLGRWMDIRVDTFKRYDMETPTSFIQGYMAAGASRTLEGGVIELICTNS